MKRIVVGLLMVAAFFAQRAGGVSSVAPNDLAGLTMWLDAGTLSLANGAEVTDWPTSGGYAYGAKQGNPSQYRPTFWTNVVNGRPVVRFDGAYNFLVPWNSDQSSYAYSALGLSTAVTFIAVAKPTGTMASAGTVVGDNGNWAFFSVGTDGIRGIRHAFDGSAQYSTLIDCFVVAAVTQTNLAAASAENRLAAYLNGELVATGVQTNSAWDISAEAMFIGAGYLGALPSGAEFTGDLAELIIYNRALSADEIAAVTRYLRNKYFEGGVYPYGLAMWLDASRLSLTEGAGVTDWPARAGSAYGAVQPNPALYQPTFHQNVLKGKPVVRFDSSGYNFLIPRHNPSDNATWSSLGITTGVTFIAVANPTRSLAQGGLLVADYDGIVNFKVATDGVNVGRHSFGAIGQYSADMAKFAIAAGTQTNLMVGGANRLTAYLWGKAGAAGDQTNDGGYDHLTEGVYFGMDYPAGIPGRPFFAGDLAEFLLYKRVIGEEEMAQVTEYLLKKYFSRGTMVLFQ